VRVAPEFFEQHVKTGFEIQAARVSQGIDEPVTLVAVHFNRSLDEVLLYFRSARVSGPKTPPVEDTRIEFSKLI
jgi:hypothetical protein